MIEIKVSGFKDQTREFEQPNQALLYLAELRQEHDDYLSPLIAHIIKPSILYRCGYTPVNADQTHVQSSLLYRDQVRDITKKYPMKIEIIEFEDMNDLV